MVENPESGARVKPVVSIVTVCRNAGAALGETFASVRAQRTSHSWEYVVVDGDSDDGTKELIEENADLLHAWISEADTGLYDAMNKGLSLARGEFVWFLNAGDQIAGEDTLEAIACECSSADLVYGLAARVKPSGQLRPWHKTTPGAGSLRPRSFARGMVVCHQALLVRREIAPEFDLGYRVSADIDWAIRCVERAPRVRYLDRVLCHFEDGGLSTRRSRVANRERFKLSVRHFGLPVTAWNHFLIVLERLGMPV